MHWEVIDTGKATAMQNMATDRALLEKLSSINHAIVHFYDWSEECATYGYFIDPHTYLDQQACSLQLARRPTGGGIIFHLWDLAFSLLVPAEHPRFSHNTLENYAFVNQIVAKAIKMLMGNDVPSHLLHQESEISSSHSATFCMANPTINDVMINGRKIAGGAQRRTKHGFLHQGTVSLVPPSEQFLRKILRNPTVLDDMLKNSSALFNVPITPSDLITIRHDFKSHLLHALVVSNQ